MMLTNKQLTALVKKEMLCLTAEILMFGGDTIEPEGTTPEYFKPLRDDYVTLRTDRLYWLAKKFPKIYSKASWEIARLRPMRPIDGPAKIGKKIRTINT